jgi:hypothetical protein
VTPFAQLAVSTVTVARDGRVYFRRAAATELWLDWEEGERVLVGGEIWVEAPAMAMSAIDPGQRIAARGELIAGAGQREHVGVVPRGEPGAAIRLRTP